MVNYYLLCRKLHVAVQVKYVWSRTGDSARALQQQHDNLCAPFYNRQQHSLHLLLLHLSHLNMSS